MNYGPLKDYLTADNAHNHLDEMSRVFDGDINFPYMTGYTQALLGDAITLLGGKERALEMIEDKQKIEELEQRIAELEETKQ